VWRGQDCFYLNTIHCIAHRSHRWIDSYVSGITQWQKYFLEAEEASYRRRMGVGNVYHRLLSQFM
jgi:hypothetical protein